MLKTEEMLIMLIIFFQKVAKTGEMLIMLIIWGLTQPQNREMQKIDWDPATDQHSLVL